MATTSAYHRSRRSSSSSGGGCFDSNPALSGPNSMPRLHQHQHHCIQFITILFIINCIRSVNCQLATNVQQNVTGVVEIKLEQETSTEVQLNGHRFQHIFRDTELGSGKVFESRHGRKQWKAVEATRHSRHSILNTQTQHKRLRQPPPPPRIARQLVSGNSVHCTHTSVISPNRLVNRFCPLITKQPDPKLAN